MISYFVSQVNDIVVAVVVVPFKLDLVAGADGNTRRSSGVGDVADDIAGRNILHGAVVRGRTDVSSASIALINAVDPETVDAGVSVGRTDEGGDDGKEGCVFNHD